MVWAFYFSKSVQNTNVELSGHLVKSQPRPGRPAEAAGVSQDVQRGGWEGSKLIHPKLAKLGLAKLGLAKIRPSKHGQIRFRPFRLRPEEWGEVGGEGREEGALVGGDLSAFLALLSLLPFSPLSPLLGALPWALSECLSVSPHLLGALFAS